jgi:hypothetical protein
MGFIGGVLPAYRASRMIIVEALGRVDRKIDEASSLSDPGPDPSFIFMFDRLSFFSSPELDTGLS